MLSHRTWKGIEAEEARSTFLDCDTACIRLSPVTSSTTHAAMDWNTCGAHIWSILHTCKIVCLAAGSLSRAFELPVTVREDKQWKACPVRRATLDILDLGNRALTDGVNDPRRRLITQCHAVGLVPFQAGRAPDGAIICLADKCILHT